MGLSLVTAPAAEPVTLAEAKLHLRQEDSTADDTLITALIVAARENVEQFTRRALIEQTWKLWLDEFPSSGVIYLPKSPLRSVVAVTYVDGAGAVQTLATTEYAIDTAATPGRIYLAYDKSWPSTRAIQDAVRVEFKGGYGTAATAVPEGIKAAMKLIIGDLYENRERTVVGTIANELPAVDALLWPHRVVEL